MGITLMAKSAQRWNGGQPKTEEQRGSSTERGYDGRWRKLAEKFKQAYPLCHDCEQQGRVTPSKEVHHIKKVVTHPHLKFDWGNLMALCKQCHAMRTRRGE